MKKQRVEKMIEENKKIEAEAGIAQTPQAEKAEEPIPEEIISEESNEIQ